MNQDEQAIRELVAQWLAASKNGDLAALMPLMADDVIFMAPGVPPFGKEAFAANSERMKRAKLEAESNIQEIQMLGDWAWMRNHLRVTFTPPGGTTKVLSGYILTILRKGPRGNWQIARDANLLMPEAAG
jgi:uncharacterized protein (TIGR02246 family)